jgi:glycosyltransferase involved in cell wall biosynthesis
MIQLGNRIKILFFIGNLETGGKERRLLELMTYLKRQDCYDLLIVMTKEVIHFPDFHSLNIPYRVVGKAKHIVFHSFYKICLDYNPDIVHTWGRMQTFYSLPAVVKLKIPLVNSQITSAPPKLNRWSVTSFIDRINFRFSTTILSNSKAGVCSFNPPLKKTKVIYNGINMNRFTSLPNAESVKAKYSINTPYTVVMSASFSANKNYGLFYRIAEKITSTRKDITFIGVGQSHDDVKFNSFLELIRKNPLIILPGRIDDVEALVNASDIGILFSTNGEGISNSIMEYMALSKPVIANEAGGTKELVRHNENGYLIDKQSDDDIVAMILELIDNSKKRENFGKRSKSIINKHFSLDKMGKSFEQIYRQTLTYKYPAPPLPYPLPETKTTSTL